MIYNEYTEGCKRLKGMQRALDRRFIREYRYRHLYGKVVFVRYHFRGKVRTEKHYFEGLEPFAILHEITPVFRKLEKDGKPERKRVDNIYALSQIEEITLVKDNERF